MNLFGEEFSAGNAGAPEKKPLADRYRPRTLEEFVGQEHLVGDGAFLSEAIKKDKIPSLILWGPPGSGKTTIARIISHYTHAEFVSFSAVVSGVKDIREVTERAKTRR
ncbi:MAG TPA: AAA family ATPase, partial [Anaerolineae bacterium]|nr:AAA family ATPase [Anaerolineae bacterium]